MENIYRIALFLAGIINILPAFLAFIPDKISKSYGIELPNENYELLLRHRAILFGIIGGLMIYSAIAKKYYTIATSVGLISMVSFILLFFLIGKDINSELKNIMIVDIVASFILCLGLLLFKLRP
jgi:heme A synthase